MADSISQQVETLCGLIKQLRYEEALDMLYDADVITYEGENPPTVGLDAYKAAGEQFLASISNYKATLLNCIVSDNMSVCEWHYTFDHVMWGHWDKTQLSVQKWKNGKIVFERHYYN